VRHLALLCLAALLLTGCGEKKHPATRIPAPPPAPEQARDREPIRVPKHAKVIFTETGMASWYGPPYHNRRAANGEIFDMNELTAAHRTLPLNSIVRVTNLKTERSALVRITDRGPFVGDRIIDLSLAAAKAVDVWRAGVARVRIEVLETPSPIDRGGRWCVQIGSIKDEDDATDLKARLAKRYKTAKVLTFPSPVGGWWVRVRVEGDDRQRAEKIIAENRLHEGTAFLVRLD